MSNALKLILIAAVIAAAFFGVGMYFHLEFFNILALIAVTCIAVVFSLVHREHRISKGDSVANVGHYFFGGIFLFGLVLTGYQLNLAPPTFEYHSCVEFYQIVRKENVGCTKEDFLKTLHLERHVAAGNSYDTRLRAALEEDLEQAYRAERSGQFVSPPFPRFQQIWGEYQAGLVNQARERLIGDWKTGVIIFIIILVGFWLNGILSWKGTEVIGEGQAVVGLLVASFSWFFWANQEYTLSNYLPLSAQSLKVISDYWYWGCALGAFALVLPLINDVAKYLGKEVIKTNVLTLGIPALVFTGGLILNPNLVSIMMLPGINQVLLTHLDLSIQVIQLSLIFGLLFGMGTLSFCEGFMKRFFPKKPAS